MTKLEKVLEFATKAHEGQKRKFNDEPYINHPIRVANRLLTHEEKVVALLHDVFEDTEHTLKEAIEILNLNDHERWALEVLTKNISESYLEYIVRIMYPDANYGKLARKVKIEDLKDNLSDLPQGHQRDKYELVLYILQEK